jgi:PAS domain S-box-containing protein
MKSTRSSSLTGPEAVSRRHIRLLRWSKYLAFLVLSIGILVLARWQWDIALFKRPLPRLTAMNPLTALCFVLAGISFLLLSPVGRRGLFLVPFPKTGRLTGGILACLVLLTSLLKIAGVFLMARLPIDRILFAEKLVTEAPGNVSDQMTIHTAFCFALSGISLLLLNRVSRRGQMPSQYVALLIAAMGLFSIIGYLYRVQETYGVFTHIPTAVDIALCFLLFSAALLLAHPESGITKEFTAGNMGILTARYLLPLIFLVPIILSYLRLLTYWKEVLGTEWGIALLVLAIILIFTGIVWYTTRLLNKREEQKRAVERSLRESEERFRLLVSSVEDYAIFMLDPAGQVISWNEGAERIKGYKKEEIIGRNISVFYTAEGLQRGEPQHNLSRARAYGRFESEGERIRKDGSVFWANVVFNAIYDTKGELVGFAKVTRDITERRKLELQLKQFNEELEEQVKRKTTELTGVFERITDAFVALDKDLCYTYLNKKAGELIHHDPASLIGKYVWDVFPDAVGSSTWLAFNKAMTEQRNIVNTDYYPPLDLWQENHLYPSPDGLSVVIRDITEEKRRGKEITDYKYALDQSSIVSRTDEKGIIRYVNDNFCKISGYTAAELIGRNHRIVGSHQHPAQFIEDLWLTISNGRVWRGEFCNEARDESIYWVDMTIIPFLNEKNEPYEYLVLEGDITERKKAEELLSRSYQDIRQLASHLQDVREEERASIAREIHDELGQQLTGLKMDLSWIAKRKTVQDDIEVKQKTTTILNLLDTAIKTVRKIATDLRPSILDDLGLIAAIEWQSEEFERRSGICTEFRSTMPEFRYSAGIAIGLFRICQESLTNVARHAEASKIFISLQEHDNENILLKIEDNGRGFEVRKTGDKKTLGLLGMRERTLMMGGEFRIESDPGKGTTLFVTVPLTIAD